MMLRGTSLVLALSLSVLGFVPMATLAQTKTAPAKAAKADAEPADVDKADIDRSQIIGNRELPKVLYIVPWKKPMPGDLSGRTLESVLDEALAPVDRDVFRRQVNYQEQSKANSKTQDAAKTEAPSGK